MTDNLILNALLLFFAVAPVFDGIVMVILFRAYRQERNRALWERLISASVLFVSSIMLAILSINRLFELHADNNLALILLVASLALTSVPGINWLYMYAFKKF